MKTILSVLILGTFVLNLGTTQAQQLNQNGCVAVAVWAHDIVWAKEMGADRERVVGYLRAQAQKEPVFKILVKRFPKIWDSGADKVVVGEAMYNECISIRGNYGTEI